MKRKNFKHIEIVEIAGKVFFSKCKAIQIEDSFAVAVKKGFSAIAVGPFGASTIDAASAIITASAIIAGSALGEVNCI